MAKKKGKMVAQISDHPEFVPTIVSIAIADLEENEGQLSQVDPVSGEDVGLPRNPRFIRSVRYKALKKSISDDPEYLLYSPLKVYPMEGGKYIVVGGNQRLHACKELGFTEVPCLVFLEETPMAKLRAWAIKDNLAFGNDEYDILANEWNMEELEAFGMELDWVAPETEAGEPGNNPEEPEEEEEEEEEADDDFTDMMYKDVLYPSDNDLEIPTLDISKQAGLLELPLSAWGADRRSRTDIVTYHFYVDDYRFEKLFRDPINLLRSGCKAIVEPNCSLHDQTPIAFGLNQIYKKRFLARYCQDVGITIYVDLNVAEKFRQYNKLGVPKGYNAFMTRGLDGWMKSLENDLKDAQEISGLEVPNLIVYGGGDEVRKFCQKHGLLYVTDFINAKKL